MEISYENYLPLTEVLADALVALDDKEQKQLSPGFYRSQVKYALDELGFSSSFIEVVVDTEMTDNLIFPIPKNCYNLKQVNAYTGSPNDVTYTQNLYWRRHVSTRGKGTGYTANINEGNTTDPFIKAPMWSSGYYYFSTQNNRIFLSDYCSAFDYVRIIFDGVPSGSLDNVAFIPPFARKAIVLWVIEKCASYLKGRDSKYRIIQLDAASQLDEYGLRGAWHEAKKRMKSLDTKKLNDVIMYNQKMNI